MTETIQYIILAIGIIAGSFGGFLYLRDTLRGIVKPNKVTWGIWGFAPIVGLAAAIYQNGYTNSLIPVFIAGIWPLLIFLGSFINKKSYWRLVKFDYVSLILGIIAIIWWILTKDAFMSLILMIIIDLIAAIPLFLKMYYHRETEKIYTAVGGLISASSGLIIVENWNNIEEYLFQAYLVLLCVTVILLYYRGHIKSLFVKPK